MISWEDHEEEMYNLEQEIDTAEDHAYRLEGRIENAKLLVQTRIDEYIVATPVGLKPVEQMDLEQILRVLEGK